jgi:hypothetical protein
VAKKKKAALKGGGGGPATLPLPQKKAARKTPKAKTGNPIEETLYPKAQVQQGIDDVLDPRDDELEEAYQQWANAKKAHVKTGDKVTESYDALKSLMREKDLTIYRLHCVSRKRLRFKPRDAEVKEETVKENNGSDD